MSFPDTHYHIRWSRSSLLDWQGFTTHAEAETAAKELVGGNETYTVEIATKGCKRCSEVVEQVLEQAMRRQATHDRMRDKFHRTERRTGANLRKLL
jgi:hypothetical protein